MLPILAVGLWSAWPTREPRTFSSNIVELRAHCCAIKNYADAETDRTRNVALLSIFSLSGGYMMVKSRALAERQRQRAQGDYSVTVDRSGTSGFLFISPNP
jgi:hypothetical protein